MVQKQHREPLHTLPIIYTGDWGFVDSMCSGTAAAGGQPGGRPRNEGATWVSQWNSKMCGEGWFPGRKGAGGQGLPAPDMGRPDPMCA